MSLLKNLFEIAGKVASVAQEIAAKQEAAAKQSTPAAATTHYDAPVEEKTDAEWHTYFREIIQSEFAGYDIKENVPVTELAGFAADEAQLYKSRPRQVYKAEWGEPYTFRRASLCSVAATATPQMSSTWSPGCTQRNSASLTSISTPRCLTSAAM